jgi:hypothetical protein
VDKNAVSGASTVAVMRQRGVGVCGVARGRCEVERGQTGNGSSAGSVAGPLCHLAAVCATDTV